MTEVDDHPLTCAECGCASDRAASGWRGYFDMDDELVLFCGDCVDRVFGE